jgi:dipeptidyl aminopeptidase/acylaminoacyl peptidase
MYKDTNLEWSPDGEEIAFLSTRSEKPQIHLIQAGGGEARPLTNIPQGVGGGPSWSPDGKHIAFTSGPQGEARDPKMPYTITRNIYRFDSMGYLDDVVQDIYVTSLEKGDVKQLTRDRCQNGAPVWSPNGKEILFTTTMKPDSHRIHPILRRVNLDCEITDILGDWGFAESANWLPDGNRIVFIGNPEGLPIGTQNNLWLVDSVGEPSCLTPGINLSVGGNLQPDMPISLYVPRILLSSDAEIAYVQVQEGGTVHIYEVSLTEVKSCTPLTTGDRTCIPLSIQGKNMVFAVTGLNDPPDLYVINIERGSEKRLTHINHDFLSERNLPKVEHLTYPSSDGVMVEGWVLLPNVGGVPYPTILYIHGGPHGAFGNIFSFDFQMLSGAGYAVLLVNQRGSTGYGNEFSTKIIGDWGNLDYKDLMAGVDLVVQRGIADPNRLGCCGLSGGGNLSCWIVGQTYRFKAAVPENPVTNWVSFYGVSDIGPLFAVSEMGGLPQDIPETYRRCSPVTYAHRCKTPTLLIQGESDYRCPAEQAEQFYTILKANGCTVEMLRLPNSPHTGSIMGPPNIRHAQNEALIKWMNRYVLGLKS